MPCMSQNLSRAAPNLSFTINLKGKYDYSCFKDEKNHNDVVILPEVSLDFRSLCLFLYNLCERGIEKFIFKVVVFQKFNYISIIVVIIVERQ